MLKKNFAILSVLLSAIFVFGGAAARGQETEAASSSNLTGIALPAGAQRILPESMPASITEGFDKVMPADGSIVRGDLETLVWMGADYKQANAPATIARLTDALKAAGWQYSVEKNENGVTVFSALREDAKRRLILGYYGATKEALVLAWTELLPANGAQTRTENVPRPIENRPARNSGGSSLVGAWSNGYSSLWSGYVPTVGPRSYTPGKSHFWKYTFHPNGTFEFIGLLQSTMYNCTTSWFQDKRGRYSIDGDRLTLTLTKNFWRQQNNCAASGNKEINHKLDPETYTFSVRRNESGKQQFCLTSDGTETCYEAGE